MSMNCKEAYLLGRFFGDGWFEKNGIAIATKSIEDVKTLLRLFDEVYGLKAKIKLRTYNDGHKVYVIRVWSKNLYIKYMQLLRTSRKKSLTAMPPELCGIAKQCFLKGVLDAESWIYTWRGKLRISLELYNEAMVKYLRSILEELKVKSSLSLCSDGAYRIDITGSHALSLINLFSYLTKNSNLPPHPGESRL